MLAMMWSNWNSCALLMRKQNAVAAMENSIAVSKKNNNKIKK